MASIRPDLGLCLAGGGNRSFWQLGLLEVLGDSILPRLGAISACSAGAAAAVMLVSGTVDRMVRVFADERRGVVTNFDAKKLLRRQRPTPHERIYRTTLRESIGERGFERIRAWPFPIRILASEPPPMLGTVGGLAAGLAAYQVEKLARPTALHPAVAPRLGFRPHLHDARDCQSLDELIDLVLASSSAPPFTKTGSFAGARLLDGSLIDNAPAFAVDELPGIDRTLVLLTRPYPASTTGQRGRRLYIAPTEAVPADLFDYRESAPIDETLALGRRDAETHRAAIDAFLGS